MINEKLFHKSSILFALSIICWAPQLFAYDLVKIFNHSDYKFYGKVTYAGCASQEVEIEPQRLDPNSKLIIPGYWQAKSRGAFNWCLVTGIKATHNQFITKNHVIEQMKKTPVFERGRDGGLYRVNGQSALSYGSVGVDSDNEFNVQRNTLGGTNLIQPYDSSGTGYSVFKIQAWGSGYRIFSKDEWKQASDNKVQKSPGFRLINTTDFPIAYSVDQVGCLHHGIIPPDVEGYDPIVQISTESAWYTLKFQVQADGIDPVTDGDCVAAAAEFAAELALDVAMAAITGGAGTLAKNVSKEGLKNAIKLAAKNVAKNSFLKTATSMSRLAAERSWKNLSKVALDSLETVATKMILDAQGNTALTAKVGKTLPVSELKRIMKIVLDSDEFRDLVFSEGLDWQTNLAGGGTGYEAISMWGQYAGYAFPFRCDKMPTYIISGGPSYFEKNGKLHIKSTPLKVKKNNDCGNDMMLASPKSASTPEETYLGPNRNRKIAYKFSFFCESTERLKNSSTNDDIQVDFYSGNTKFASKTIVPDTHGCGGLTSNGEHNRSPRVNAIVEVPLDSKVPINLSHIVLTTQGFDSLFIDYAKLHILDVPKSCDPNLKAVQYGLVDSAHCDDQKDTRIKSWGGYLGSGYCLNSQEIVPADWAQESDQLKKDGCHYKVEFDVSGRGGVRGFKNPNPPKAKKLWTNAQYAKYEAFKNAAKTEFPTQSPIGAGTYYARFNNKQRQYAGEIIFSRISNEWMLFLKGDPKVYIYKEVSRTTHKITLSDKNHKVFLNLDIKNKKALFIQGKQSRFGYHIFEHYGI